ncbi:Protein kinase PINOID 2 [Acorus calamus]|uniref:non-specific serine/threonine protein kinase n=1 Tax=Acorus calamus TaxID=4465 RepID=A0AAV9E0L6_ACOCL|nr:Protein kinase PINOID 2 [Acorus calamus]
MLSDFDLSLKCDVMPRLMTPEAATATTTAAERTPFCSGPSCAIHMKPVLTCFYGAANRESGSEKDHKKKEKDRRPIEPELVAEPVSARSRSFVGTHEYLAPEVISGLGHGSEVDWWTLGVFMYELLFGRTPFKGEDNEKTLINIIKQPLRFPRLDINSTSCRDIEELVKARDLISRLLVKNPKRRIGSLRGAVEIKRHEFFKGVNWALIRTVKPPEVPKESQRIRNKEPVGGVVAAQRHGKRERGASATYSIPQYFEYF